MEKAHKFFGAEGHLTDEGTALYVDALKLGVLDQLPIRIKDHVAECHECKKTVTGLFAVLEDADYRGMRSHPFFQLREAKEASRFPGYLRVAAIIAGVALLPVLMYFARPFKHGEPAGQPPGGEAIRSADSVGGDHDTSAGPHNLRRNEFAANFAPDPGLEDLVNGRPRSEALSVISPAQGGILGANAAFRWKAKEGKSQKLRIMNNRGTAVLTKVVSHGEFTLRQKLAPGLYYWKIESEAELLYVGKFLVR